MKFNFVNTAGSFVLLSILITGCNNSEPTTVTANTQEDMKHDHKHQHGKGHKHDHTHDEHFEGSHSHEHSHSHRHDESLHGGQIVSIGHTHHKKDATHYHAEVMPIRDNQISFHLLIEESMGKLKDYPLAASEIIALIDKKDNTRPREVKFIAKSQGKSSSQFSAQIPEPFLEIEKLSIVIPKIKLGTERFSFSFKVSPGKASVNDQNKKNKDGSGEKSE